MSGEIKLFMMASIVFIGALLFSCSAIDVDDTVCNDPADVDESALLQMWTDTVPRTEESYPIPSNDYRLPLERTTVAEGSLFSPKAMHASSHHRPRTLSRLTMKPQRWGTPYPPVGMTSLQSQHRQPSPLEQLHPQSQMEPLSLEMAPSEKNSLDERVATGDLSLLNRKQPERKNDIMGLMQNDMTLQVEQTYAQQGTANASAEAMLQSMRVLKSANHALDMENVEVKHALDMQKYQNVADAMAREQKVQALKAESEAERLESKHLREVLEQHTQKETQQALEEKELKSRLDKMSREMQSAMDELKQEHAQAQKTNLGVKEKVDWARKVSEQAAREMKYAKIIEKQAAKSVSDLRNALFKVKKDVLVTADATNESFGFSDAIDPPAISRGTMLDDE